MFPLGVGSIAVTQAFLKGEWADPLSRRLDMVGCLIYAGAILSLVYGATVMPSPLGCTLIPAGALGLVLFFVTLMLNIIALYVVRKYREQYE